MTTLQGMTTTSAPRTRSQQARLLKSLDTLPACFSTPGEVFTSNDAESVGVDSRRIGRLVRHGIWLRIAPNHYTLWRTPEIPLPLPTLLRGALSAYPASPVVGLSSAVRLLHTGLADALPTTHHCGIHLIHPAGPSKAHQPPRLPGVEPVHLHWRALQPHEITTVNGFPVTTPVRTLRDLIPELDHTHAVCLLDAALHTGVITSQELADVVGCARTAPARSRLRIRRAVAAARPGAQSVLETRLRLLCDQAGLSPDALQLEIPGTAGFSWHADMAWVRPLGTLIVECDGQRYHDTVEAVFKDRHRQNDLQLAGCRLLRITWQDVMRPSRTLAHIAQALRSLNG